MNTQCIQNVSHISMNICIHFVYKIKRTVVAKFCIQNVYKVCRNMVYITFCVHIFWSTKSVYHKNYVYNFIQNSTECIYR